MDVKRIEKNKPSTLTETLIITYISRLFQKVVNKITSLFMGFIALPKN